MRDRVAICFDLFTRPRVLGAAPVILAVCLSACADRAQDPVEIFATQVPVNGEAPASVVRPLERGAYLVEVREQELDLRVIVDAAGTASTLEDRAPRYGAVYKIVSLESPAELRVEITSVDHETKRGNAAVRISRWLREPGAAPGELEAGYRARSEAGELAIAGDPKSWALAADKLYEAVTHFDAAGDDAAIADAAFALAYIQFGPRDQFAAAVRACEMAADAYDDAGDEVGIHNANLLRAATEVDQAAAMNGETQRAEQRALNTKADRVLEESTRWFTEHGLPLRAQYAVNMRGSRASNIGEYEAAARLFDEAVDMARSNQDVREEARSLANLAAIHVYLGESAKAAEEYAALLPLLDGTRSYQYAALLGNYGVTLIDTGDFDRALDAHNKALEIYKALDEKSEIAIEYAQLGSLYLRMGDAARALATLKEAITAHEAAKDAQPLAGTLRLAANAASTLEQHAAALDYLQRSARTDSNPQSVARTRVLMAGELLALGKPDAAAAELIEPLKSTNKLVLASALEERSRLRFAEGRVQEAIEDLRAADANYRALGLDFDRIEPLTALSRALLGTGDLTNAAAAADEAIAIVGHIRVKSANPEWRARFGSARYAPYEARIAVHLASPDGDAPWQAFRLAEEVRARSLTDELTSGDAKMRRVDPEESALRSRLTTLQARLEASLQNPGSGDSDTASLASAITETRARIDAIRARHGVVASGSSLPSSMAEVQSALPRSVGVLAYFVGESNSYAWFLTQGGLRHTTLPGRRKLEPLIAAVQGEQRRGGASASRELGTLLFGSLLDGVREERLLILADGPLNRVPFAALPVPASPDTPLIGRFIVGNAPSLWLATTNRGLARSRNTRVAVISDPVYAADDRRLADSGAIANLRGPIAPSLNRRTRLRYSALEASAVVREFGPTVTTQLSGFDATRERVLSLPSGELAVLHFAVHAVTRGDEPEQSALFLSEYSAKGELQKDSKVTALDIAQSGLRADVVVLSACGTGDGNALRGEGVLGLTYEFLANGSHSVVASLWPIEDASTARFMNEFYRAYRENGSAADALRAAQLKMRAAGTSGVWSSFVVRANEFP
jgi:tetratricopeptide (TPR) repeat protein